jgi:hypothetical protein
MIDKLQRAKVQYVGMRGGEKDIDEVEPVIEFSANMSQDTKENCIKIAKEGMSKIKILILLRIYNR